MAFILRTKELERNFNLNSNQLAISDFVMQLKPKTETDTKVEAVEIPSFLNASLQPLKQNTVLYDNLTLKTYRKIDCQDEAL
jgi:hypothetical protein